MVKQETIFKIVVRFNSPNNISEIQDTVNNLMSTQLLFIDNLISAPFTNETLSQKTTVVQLNSGKFLVYPKFGVKGESNMRQSTLNKKYDLIYDNLKSLLQTHLTNQLDATDFEWHIHKTTGVVDE